MDCSFQGVQWAASTDLGVSQLYLSRAKLEAVRKWFDPNRMHLCAPLPVYDFGDGRLTLTDGHSRAFAAYQYQVRIPIVYDTDDIVTGEEGQMLYQNDLIWCRRFHIETIADLEPRIVSAAAYESLWIDRCEQAYSLLTRTNEEERAAIQRQHPGLFLSGVNEDFSICFFEDLQGRRVEVPFSRSASWTTPPACP